MIEVEGALPVRVQVDGRLHAELVAHLEGELGWQVTGGDELPAALALVDVGAPIPTDVPSLLLVRDDDCPATAARTAPRASAVLAWPQDRDALSEMAHRAIGGATPAAGVLTVRVGGAAGGVGTSTILLALGGLVAWRDRPVLAVVSGDVPVPDVPLVDPGALSAHRTWDAAAVAPGVADLRVLVAGRGARAPVEAPAGTVALVDDGVSTDVDLLVCTRDRAGVEALDSTSAAVAVVVDRGVVPAERFRRLTARGPRQVWVEHSVRVARAGAERHVPAGLPGRWLAPLQPLADSLR
jgi:hypothetical protein